MQSVSTLFEWVRMSYIKERNISENVIKCITSHKDISIYLHNIIIENSLKGTIKIKLSEKEKKILKDIGFYIFDIHYGDSNLTTIEWI